MIDLEIGKVKYELPESYDELSLGKFIELSKVLDNKNDSKSDLRFSLEILSKLIGCDIAVLYLLSVSDMNILVDEISWVNNNPTKKTKKNITIDGNDYGFVSLNGITTGEMISIESFQQNLTDNRDNLHFVMAILFRPIEDGKVVKLEDDFDVIRSRAEMFKEKMMIGEVYGPLINFMNGGTKSSMKTSVLSSTLKIKKRKVSSLKK